MSARMPMTCSVPRVLVSAISSGSGKTTVVCGLLRCLTRRGLAVNSYKCGPDYIDPMFHRSVLGTPCRNLDLYFSSEAQVRSLLGEGSRSADIAVLEGVMGFYDGLGGTDTQASAYHLAKTTSSPVILVVDGRGTSLTLAAVVDGIMRFKEDSGVCGVIINHSSKMGHRLLAPILERECGVEVLGYVEEDPEIALESRHLGLVTAAEIDDLNVRIDHLADMFESTIDIDELIEMARSARPFEYEMMRYAPICAGEPVIAVAYDEAFCFYYDENLEMLEGLGARMEFFSPMNDTELPQGTGLVYLGGGYPELHAAELSANLEMLDAMRAAHASGMPIFAECGGFLYLKEYLEDIDGNVYGMCGILPGTAKYTGHLKRFGYVELTCAQDGLGVRAGQSMRAHEFHYYDSDDNGDAFRAVKPMSGRGWDCGIVTSDLLAGFPHLYLPACPEVAQRLVEAAASFSATGFPA